MFAQRDGAVAIPLTPPSVDTAVIVAIVKSCVTAGAEPRAKSSAASNNNWSTSKSSRHTFNIS